MNAQKLLQAASAGFIKKDLPAIRVGNTVKVHVKVVEGESERIQPFEGVVTAKRGSGISETFTVRKISFGVGIERTFPLHSPRLVKIEITKMTTARRAKLFYLRELTGKAARLSENEAAENVSQPAAGTSAKLHAEHEADHKPKTKKPEPALT